MNPDFCEKRRVVINSEKFLRVEGVLQNHDHTISIKASPVLPICLTAVRALGATKKLNVMGWHKMCSPRIAFWRESRTNLNWRRQFGCKRQTF